MCRYLSARKYGFRNTFTNNRPSLPLQNIENATHSQNRAEFHALFVPNRSLLCDKRLQDLGVYGSFTFIDELGTFWFPLEADLISMEAPRDTQFDRRNYFDISSVGRNVGLLDLLPLVFLFF